MMETESPFLFVGNGPYANRGCEAIAKSSIRLIREYFPNAPITNGNPGGGYDQADETEPNVTHKACRCFADGFSRMGASSLIFSRTGLMLDLSKPGQLVRTEAPASRAVLSMGGDLYGLSMGKQTLLQYIFIGEAALRARKPFVIWCATIGKMDSEPRLKKKAMEHFRRCSLILVRDQDSYDYLAENGVRGNVRLVADPAFLLEPLEPKAPLPFPEPLEEMIGFNLVAAYGRVGDALSFRDMVKLGADCVEAIVKKTKRQVLLVPHVVAFPPEECPDSDTMYLALIREALAARGIKVAQLPSALRSWEIKWVLGRLRAYVGSRFHSTVGALGSGTPTLSIPYSEKGPALSRLLLGHTDFVIPWRQLEPEFLAEKVSALLDAEQDVRERLRNRLPEIRAMSHRAGDHLRELLG